MKRYLLLILAVMVSAVGLGQNSKKINPKPKDMNWTQEWKSVDDLMAKNSFRSAYDASQKLFDYAREQKDSRNTLVGAYKLAMIGDLFQEASADSALKRYQEVLPLLDQVDQAVCHASLAQFYNDYKSQNRWRLQQNKDTDEKDLDYKLWPVGRFDAAIAEHVAASLKEPRLLQNIDIHEVSMFCQSNVRYRSKVDSTMCTTPTLYDLLVRMAIEELVDYGEKQSLLKDQMAFHANDKDDFMKVYLDWRMTELLNEMPNHPKLTAADYERYIDRYEGSECAYLAKFYYEAGRLCERAGDYVKAKEYYERGIARFPKSEGGTDCSNSLAEMLRPRVSVEMESQQMTQRDMLAVATIRNADTIYCRIVDGKTKLVDRNSQKEFVAALAKMKVLKAWSQAVPHRDDYQKQETYLYLPPMNGGEYRLLVSTTADFVSNGVGVYEFDCCDARFYSAIPGSELGQAGYLLDMQTGKPIVGQKVEITKYDYRKQNDVVVLGSAITDEQGYYHFAKSEGGIVRTTYQGVTIMEYAGWSPGQSEPEVEYDCEIFVDRPVYRPGETVSYAVVCYRTDHRHKGNVAAQTEIRMELRDNEYMLIESDTLTTDAYGRCHGTFVIPQDAVPGNFTLVSAVEKITRFAHFKVEAYKQPKFLVTLEGDKAVHRFGQNVKVEGKAASYSEVPVSGAKVVYSVERGEMFRPWRWWYMPYSETVTVASGETMSDAQGRFAIEFVPEPDSTVELTNKPCFEYMVSVDVSDVNGETHSQQYTLRVGYEHGGIVVQSGTMTELEEVPFKYTNLDGDDLAGEVSVTVEKLVSPATPHLGHPMQSKSVLQPLTRQEFEKRFPLIAYDLSELEPEEWVVERKVYSTLVQAKAEGGNKVVMPRLGSGVYRLTFTTTDSTTGEKVEAVSHISLNGLKDAHVQSPNLLSVVGEKDGNLQYELGSTMLVGIGTRYEDVTVTYVVSAGERVISRQQMRLSKEQKVVKIPVGEECLGGISVNVMAVKDGIGVSKHLHAEVPYSHKQLEVRFESFRDRLEPGEKETWRLAVRNKQTGTPATAALMLTMYDAALDNYGTLNWRFAPWVRNDVEHYFSNSQVQNAYLQDFQKEITRKNYTGPYPFEWVLTTGMTGNIIATVGGVGYAASARGEDGMVTNAAKRMGAVMPKAVVEEKAVVTDLAIVDNDVMIAEESALVLPEVKEERQNVLPQLRTNLNTLAFFAPMLETKEDGTVEYTFTVPELLTKWNVLGVAYTQDLKVGQLRNGLVTRKELMVQPNVPRFLRQGDTLDFLVKVSNMSEKEQLVKVTFELTDAATGKAVGAYTPQQLQMEAQSTAAVSFRIAVPQEVFMATYKIVAQSETCSDGEQGPLPVLTNRELVTVSQSMYMNGAGEKRYSLGPITQTLGTSATHEPHLLKVEFTPNPVWYAVQAMPYMQDKENPSNSYLANTIYVNTLAAKLVHDNPEIQSVFAAWEKDSNNALVSQLEKNADVKQIVLSETPWLRDGNNEAERMHRMANYFDAEGLKQSLQEKGKKLFEEQRRDGGWSWMPGDKVANVWTTQYVLETFGRMEHFTGEKVWNKELGKALRYVDADYYDYYVRLKKYTTLFDPVNLDYLYMRSFYPKVNFAKNHKVAYDFFYSNALKHYTSYQGLYSRAMLALVFQRHGDTKQARDIVRTLKECALYSDEMGMYWRDNVSSYWWYQRPIETQALLIEAFAEVTPDDKESIGKMQQWLLKQKQTTSWTSDIATVDAITALLVGTTHARLDTAQAEIMVAGQRVEEASMAGTGYVVKSWTGEELTGLTQEIVQGKDEIVIKKVTDGIAWGAAYYQYFEDMDKVPASEMGVKLQKQYYIVNNDGTLTTVENKTLKVGDRVKVRILVDCDRNLEYLQLKDGRASSMEPVNTASGWSWNDGLSYYVAVYDASTSFFINRLEKGKYVVEYDLYVTNSGTFTTAPAVMQCLYAPEFRATTAGGRLRIE